MNKSNLDTVSLDVQDLIVDYNTEDGNVRAVDNVSFQLKEGEVLGLVGESGCGKSTLGFSLLKLLRGGSIKNGKILYEGENLVNIGSKKMRKYRGSELSMIFQSSQNVLNPLQRISQHFKDTLKAHNQWSKENWQEVIDLLERVEIPNNRIDDYSFQFSGGMQQRIVIALAIMLKPKILIADEPTTALDVLVQARITRLLKQLKDEFDLTMIFISHDLGVVAEISNRVAIMYAGQLVEIGDTKGIFSDPKHPYTEALIRAIPDVKDRKKSKQKSIPGTPPDLTNPPDGCRFAERCTFALDLCRENDPELIQLNTKNDDYVVRCFKYYEEYKNEFD